MLVKFKMKYPEPKTKFEARMGLKLLKARMRKEINKEDYEFKEACEKVLRE